MKLLVAVLFWNLFVAQAQSSKSVEHLSNETRQSVKQAESEREAKRYERAVLYVLIVQDADVIYTSVSETEDLAFHHKARAHRVGAR
jgi:HD superfamily phosphodiesterase